MSAIFRSEEMQLCQLFLQTEAAYACISELGELGRVQFKDLNENVNAFQRTFVNEVRRCEEMERKLRYTEKEILKEGMKITDLGENPKAPFPKEMHDMEIEFDRMDTELRQVNTNNEAIKQNFLELTELRAVLNKSQMYFDAYGQDIRTMMEEEHHNEEAIIGTARPGTAALGFFVGTVLREKLHVFERVMRFITHSNVFMRSEEIDQTLEDPVTGDMMHKCMFIVFYQGEQLKNKVKKVCEGLRANIYPVPETAQGRNEMLVGVTTRLSDLENVLSQSKEHRHRVLVNAQKDIRVWTIKVEKIKAIYHTMNMLKVHQNSLIAECWFPVKAIDEIKMALNSGEKASGSSIASVIQSMAIHEDPPTYYNGNKFVQGFQNVVDSYGVATYGEVNPALYTCITFPFLFAVMFGDAGHGLIMFLFGAWMVIREKSLLAAKINNEIWTMFFGGRYIIMLMGAFSFYTGVIYNDAFSKSFNIFGSQWVPEISDKVLDANEVIQLDPVDYHLNGTAYMVGVDPIWQSAKNKILFLNSLKMKMAIILGVIHMMFGVFLGIFNHIHFKRKMDLLLTFLPKLLFLGCLFGYLVAVVFYKWLKFDAKSSSSAPALLIHYINMFMFKYNYRSDSSNSTTTDTTPLANTVYYEGQQTVQTIMLLLAVLAIPVLLIVKPAYTIISNKKAREAREGGSNAQHREALLNHEVPPAIPSSSAKAESQSNPVAVGEVELGHVNNAYQQDTFTATENGRKGDPNFNSAVVNSDEEEELRAMARTEHTSGGHGGHHDKETSEIIIEDAIETIEFCLGCVSHTASYLRLWALSLAHAQLSEVLWSMVMRLGLTMMGKYVGCVPIFIIFFFWANLTIGILLLMEGLSAFLHTLRLHWVEFMSKFYSGEGYHFQPFTFNHILTMTSLEDVTA